MSDFELKDEFQQNYKYAQDYWAPYVQNALTYSLAYSGYTWTNEERKMLAKEGREAIEFNIMRRPIEFFSGYLRDNMKSIVIAPVERSDQTTADQFTKISDYVWDKGSGYNQFLGACDEMFKAGLCLCGIQLDYSKDFINGDVTFYKRTFNSCYLDPTFENQDLSDCNFAITRDLVNPAYAKQLLPFIDDKIIDDLHGFSRDNKFNSFHPQFTNMNLSRNVIAYDQYYRRSSRKRKYLIDEETDFYRDITNLSKEEIDQLKDGINRFRLIREEAQALGEDDSDIPRLNIKEVDRPFVELNIMLNGEPVYSGEDRTGITDTFPFVPLLCYFEPSVWLPTQRVQGIASAEFSNQRQFNKRHMKIQDMFDSVISTGYKYLIGSVPDPTEMQQSGQNKIIGVDPDNAPEGLNSVQELHGGNVPPALIEYQRILDELSLTLANVNESVLGQDEGGNTAVSGRLAQVRIAQGLRANRKVFDNIEYSQQLLGGLVLKAIQNNYSPGKIERILGETPTDQFYDNQFEQYDAVIKEGVRTKSQKDAYYYELVNLKREGIVDVPQAAIVDALQMTGLDDLKKAIEQQQEQQQQQQQKIDNQEVAALELINSQKESNLALAQVRRAREIGEIGLMQERSSEAQENMAQAALARAKTITEIATMEDDRILRVLEFVNSLENQQSEKRNQITGQSLMIADKINEDTEGTVENKEMQPKEALISQLTDQIQNPMVDPQQF